MPYLNAVLTFDYSFWRKLGFAFPNRFKYALTINNIASITIRYKILTEENGHVSVIRKVSVSSPYRDCFGCLHPQDAEVNCYSNDTFIDAYIFTEGTNSSPFLDHILGHLMPIGGDCDEVCAQIYTVVNTLDKYTYAFVDNLLPSFLWWRLKRRLTKIHSGISEFTILSKIR